MRVPAAVIVMCTLFGCTDIPSGANTIASIQFDSLPFPSVVLGDTLRNANGQAAPLTARAFSYGGSPVADAPFRYLALDRGLTVDSVTGRVVGDSVRAVPARVAATVAGLQAVLPIPVTFRPDTVVATHVRDSLLYSITDSTLNISAPLSVTVRHTLTRSDSLVRAWLVTFAITNQPDTLAAQLVNDANNPSASDTTDASGLASRKIRIRPTRLKSVNDSVLVLASVRYRGVHVRGSPALMVLKLRPK